jgi:hypothetical protein
MTANEETQPRIEPRTRLREIKAGNLTLYRQITTEARLMRRPLILTRLHSHDWRPAGILPAAATVPHAG